MKAYWKYLIIGAAIVVSAWLLARAYTYKYHAQETIVVTGLGETEFSSDLIVWNGFITAEAQNVEAGYAQIESSKKKVYDYLLSKGIAAEAVVFQFVNVTKQYEPVYSANGSWAGQRFTGYRLSQGFTVESKSVDAVENVSREISSLIAQGVSIEAMQPDYYYTKLDDVKLSLIEKASADARVRAEKIAVNAGAKLGGVASARMGVFQITGANTNEEFSAGGSFNTSSRQKKPVSPCGSNTALSKRYGKSCKNRPGAYLPMDGTDIFRPASRSGRFEERCGLARGIGCLRSVGDVCAVGRGADFVQTCPRGCSGAGCGRSQDGRIRT